MTRELALLAAGCTALGARGAVVAAAPIAASIGAHALRSGGSAYDAVIAAGLAETVLLPPKCGLAGDLVALRLRPGAGRPDALLAIGAAPAALAEAAREHGGLPDVGPLSVGVPGAPAGYAALAESATLPLADLAAPAAALAREGFPWAPICAELTGEAQALLVEQNPDGTPYLPGGRPMAAGTIVTLPGLGIVLEELVSRGRELFVGPLGDAVIDRVRRAGGILTAEDLRTPAARWQEARHRLVGEWDVWASPAPTHGPALLDALELLHANADTRPLDAVREAAGRHARWLADPLVPGGTSLVGAADSAGNVVLLMHSNSYPRYGSGLVVDELQLVLSNRAGRGFAADPAHPNHPSPGRRPATTLHLWAAGPQGTGPAFLGGTPGGANQMPWNVQLISQLLAGERDPGRLVTAPRWAWDGPTTTLELELGLDVTDVTRDVGINIEHRPSLSLRSTQQILCRPLPGHPIVGAADPRAGGSAAAV